MEGVTGGSFRYYDLAVMSRARCRCATPVCFAALKHLQWEEDGGRNISLHITRR